MSIPTPSNLLQALWRWATEYDPKKVGTWQKWFQDMEPHEKVKTQAELITLLVAMISIAFLFYQNHLMRKQTQAQIDTIWSSTYSSVFENQLNINKTFIEEPELFPYFDEGRDIYSRENQDFYDLNCSVLQSELDCIELYCSETGDVEQCLQSKYKILSMADYIIDYVDLFYAQYDPIFRPGSIRYVDFYKGLSENDKETLCSWEDYFGGLFERSPILIRRLNEKRDYYSYWFVERINYLEDGLRDENCST